MKIPTGILPQYRTLRECSCIVEFIYSDHAVFQIRRVDYLGIIFLIFLNKRVVFPH